MTLGYIRNESIKKIYTQNVIIVRIFLRIVLKKMFKISLLVSHLLIIQELAYIQVDLNSAALLGYQNRLYALFL